MQCCVSAGVYSKVDQLYTLHLANASNERYSKGLVCVSIIVIILMQFYLLKDVAPQRRTHRRADLNPPFCMSTRCFIPSTHLEPSCWFPQPLSLLLLIVKPLSICLHSLFRWQAQSTTALSLPSWTQEILTGLL